MMKSIRNNAYSLLAANGVCVVSLLNGGCHHGYGYHVTQEAMAAVPTQSAQIKVVPTDTLDALYKKIYHAKSNYYEQVNHVVDWQTFQETVDKHGLLLGDALRCCRNKTGYRLSACHLYDLVCKNHFDLVARVLLSGVVDMKSQLHGADSQKELKTNIRLSKNQLLQDALWISERMQQLSSTSADFSTLAFNQALNQYNDHFLLQMKWNALPMHIRSETKHIHKNYISYMESLIAKADTWEHRLRLLYHLRSEDVAQWRTAFEIIDDEHPNGTNVLFPEAYRTLHKYGYPLAQSKEDLTRIKTYLKETYPQGFYRVQPDILDFHDANGQEEMQYNKRYMDACVAPTSEKMLNNWMQFYHHTQQNNGKFQEIGLQCFERTGVKASIHGIAALIIRSGNNTRENTHLTEIAKWAITHDLVDDLGKKTTFLPLSDGEGTLREVAAYYQMHEIVHVIDRAIADKN